MNPPLDRSAVPAGWRKTALLVLTASAALFLAQPSPAAVLAGWDVHGQLGGANAFGPSPLAATSTDPNLTVGGLTRGSGVATTGATGAARGWGGVSWTSASAAAAITAGDVVTFTIAANPGYVVSLTAVSRFDYRRSSSGPTSGVLQYQIDSGAFNDIASVSYGSTASAGASLSAIDLSGIASLQNLAAGTTVTLRIVNYAGAGATGSWYIFDTANSTAADLEITGTVVSAGNVVNGLCGAANAQTFSVAPSANLCSAGAASAVSGSGPWNWTCAGSNGGSTASCAASTSVLPICP